jgi:hypothetical protein
MADPKFREHQRAHRRDPHIAPINDFVATLQEPDGRGWVPEVAPLHGGVDATVLSVLRDPGPMTQEGKGSAFLCVENDDPTAERQLKLFDEFGIPVRQVLPWNAYPWYINRAPRAAECEHGAAVLAELIDLLPKLVVVLLQGNDAVNAWRRVVSARPNLVEDRKLEVVESIHPGRQALWTADPGQREAREAKQRSAYERVAAVLGSSSQLR